MHLGIADLVKYVKTTLFPADIHSSLFIVFSLFANSNLLFNLHEKNYSDNMQDSG